MSEDILIEASTETKHWLDLVEKRIKKEIDPQLYLKCHKYWASLRKKGERRVLAFFNPRKDYIRVFLKFSKASSNLIEKSPSTKTWGEYFPGIFHIRKEEHINQVIRITNSLYTLNFRLVEENEVEKTLIDIANNIKSLHEDIMVQFEIDRILNILSEFEIRKNPEKVMKKVFSNIKRLDKSPKEYEEFLKNLNAALKLKEEYYEIFKKTKREKFLSALDKASNEIFGGALRELGSLIVECFKDAIDR